MKVCFMLLLVIPYSYSFGNNFYVTTTSDSGPGSLRAAIDSANNNPGNDTITLQLTIRDTIYLQSVLPGINTDSLTIAGLYCQNPTLCGTTVSGNNAFLSSTGYLSLQSVNMFNCQTSGSAIASAVSAPVLYVNNCYFQNNWNVTDTFAYGGAIAANTAWICNSTFQNNTCGPSPNGYGAAVRVFNAGHFFNCTFSGNMAGLAGGAIGGDSLQVVNCTFAGNTAASFGGALAGAGTGNILIANIFWNNTSAASGGVYFQQPVNSSGCNVLQDSSDNMNFLTSATDVAGINPMLDTPGYYSGCVPVIPIFCGSVAQDLASCPGATDSDAEGIPAVGIRDAGAFEITYPDINLGVDTVDSIAPGTTADLMSFFNVNGLTVHWLQNIPDSTQADTGTYTIVATDFLRCGSDTATIVVVYSLGTGIIENTFNRIHIYPNPAAGQITIQTDQLDNGPVVLNLFNTLGQNVAHFEKVYSGGRLNLDLQAVSAGLYFLDLQTASGKQLSTTLSVLPK